MGRVARVGLQEPCAVGDVAVLVLRDPLEAEVMARKDALALHPAGLEVLARERERALDDHVVDDDEVDLRLDVARVRDERLVGVDEVLVEKRDVVLVELGATAAQAVLEAPVVLQHVLVQAVEVLGVARLVDLLGGEGRPPRAGPRRP